jgi:5-methylcytosine-specific restriction endonuclease McrA
MPTQEDIRRERDAVAAVRKAAAELAPHLRFVWHWGDDNGGWVTEVLRKAAEDAGMPVRYSPEACTKPKGAKAFISKSLRKAVMERDKYRCVRCDSHLDLEPDHVIPESRGGPTTLENLQTLCRPCNLKKGVKMPEDVDNGY